MAQCININSPEVLALKEKSGLSDFEIEVYAQYYMDKFGRMPHLDEMRSSDSSKYLSKFLKLNDKNSTNFSRLVDMTGVETVEEINAKLNDDLRDIEVSVLQLNEKAIVDIQKRPESKEVAPIGIKNDVNNKVFWEETTNKLAKLYGIKIIPVNSDVISDWEGITDAKSREAFIYNGNIYINTDLASIDAPLHELMHIFAGAMRQQSPQLYLELINSVEKLPNYEAIASKFSNRTRNDLNEEVFVEAFSKYLTGLDSNFDNLSDEVFHEIFYNIYRTLDSILMGETSSRVISKSDLINMSMKELANRVNSAMMDNQFRGSIDSAAEHRILANYKQELMEKGELIENCG